MFHAVKKKKEKIMQDSDSMLYETAPPTAWNRLKIMCKMDLMIKKMSLVSIKRVSCDESSWPESASTALWWR